jgi:hypothetical protein
MKDAIIKFMNTDDLSVKTGKTGTIRAAFVSRKDYGELNNMKGAALRRAHDAYRTERSREMGGEVAKAVGSGQIFITSLTRNAKGTAGSIRYVHDLHAKTERRSQSEAEKLIALLTKALGGDKLQALVKEGADKLASEVAGAIAPVQTPTA